MVRTRSATLRSRSGPPTRATSNSKEQPAKRVAKAPRRTVKQKKMPTLKETIRKDAVRRQKQREKEINKKTKVAKEGQKILKKLASKLSSSQREYAQELQDRLLREHNSNISWWGIACDTCGLELINPRPNMVTMSCPPKRYVACVVCGLSTCR